jgi:hypothetical protein
LNSYQIISQELRKWISDETNEWTVLQGRVLQNRGSVWDRIEGDLRIIQRTRSESGERLLQRLGGIFAARSTRSAFGFGFGAAAAVLVISFAIRSNITPSSRTSVALQQLALNASQIESAEVRSPAVSVNDALTRGEVHSGVKELPRFGAAALPVLLIPDSTASAYLSQLASRQASDAGELGANLATSRDQSTASIAPKMLVAQRSSVSSGASVSSGERAPSGERANEKDRFRNWRMHLPARQIFNRNFVLGGLQAEGADIHWIKSEKAVDILPTERQGEPPVIWITRSSSNDR